MKPTSYPAQTGLYRISYIAANQEVYAVHQNAVPSKATGRTLCVRIKEKNKLTQKYCHLSPLLSVLPPIETPVEESREIVLLLFCMITYQEYTLQFSFVMSHGFFP